MRLSYKRTLLIAGAICTVLFIVSVSLSYFLFSYSLPYNIEFIAKYSNIDDRLLSQQLQEDFHITLPKDARIVYCTFWNNREYTNPVIYICGEFTEEAETLNIFDFEMIEKEQSEGIAVYEGVGEYSDYNIQIKDNNQILMQKTHFDHTIPALLKQEPELHFWNAYRDSEREKQR